jgi:hypothetical protein
MHREKVVAILNELDIQDAIVIIESIGKEFRRKNSIRINTQIGQKSLNLNRTIKTKK